MHGWPQPRVLSCATLPIMRHGLGFPRARRCHGGLHRLRQSVFAAGAAARAGARIRRRRRRHQRADDRRHRGDRAHRAVHRRARRRSRPQTPDHRRRVRNRGADADHGFGDQRAATCVLALRAGAVIAADLHRRRRLCRRRMAAGRRAARRRAVYFRIERRRFLRPLRHRRGGRSARLARFLCRGGPAHAGRRA